MYLSLKKETYKAGSVLLARFVCGPFNRLKNLFARVNAARSTSRVLLRERGLEQKANVFCTKIV